MVEEVKKKKTNQDKATNKKGDFLISLNCVK
jgi:hypothetical protein